MSNGRIFGVSCPRCGETVSIAASFDPGDPGCYSGPYEYSYPATGPELEEIDSFDFDCGHDLPHIIPFRKVWKRVRHSRNIFYPARPVLEWYTRRTDYPSIWFWKLIDEQVDEAYNDNNFEVDPYEPNYPDYE